MAFKVGRIKPPEEIERQRVKMLEIGLIKMKARHEREIESQLNKIEQAKHKHLVTKMEEGK